MKYLLFFMGFLVACSGAEGLDVGGVYVRYAEGEYSRTWDTVVVGVYDARTGALTVEERSGVERMRGSVVQPKTVVVKQWVVSYDPSLRQGQEVRTGRQFDFSGVGRLRVGRAEFFRVK